MPHSNDLFFLTELIGTIAFSISGAALAIERGLDLFGVAFLGMTTAIGGGILRDMLLGQVPPQAFLHPVYLTIAILVSLGVFAAAWFRRRSEGLSPLMDGAALNLCDAAGLGVFTVIGVQNTVNAGFGANAAFCIFLGLTTGVGGGMLRDILSHSTPAVLKKNIYAVASLAGALCYYVMQLYRIPGAIFASVLLVMLLRLLAARHRWALPRI